MSLKACILGLLSLRDMTGYELYKTFENSVSYNWSSSRTQIYTALKTLNKSGLVESDLIVQISKPNKKVYRITPEGKKSLEEWLMAPAENRLAKDEFLVRVFFANYIDDSKAMEILENNLNSMEQQVEELGEIRKRITRRPSKNPRARTYQLMALDLRVSGLKGMIDETQRQMEEINRNSIDHHNEQI
ncbi:PadR family transcriptional regulator [Bacillus sp. Marseille-P3661]|uniref:PadR family transcriptional regulator n=1 Tax=Bacillus sp. Marseille-P3661 TaxID=1936234 RepID=UPI000C82A53B|nr:PadR family transcriptional regulator [Bacillus sp. Marseille-P3661]